MFPYRNEASFSKAVCAKLRKQGCFVQRIETGSTGRGVPDIYCIYPDGTPVWLELKRVHCSAKGRDRLKVPWRAGQQAWLREVSKVYKQLCYTLCCCDDVILQIPHTLLHPNDIVLFSKCHFIWSISQL